ncbi:hypothetical protein B0A69_16560 [Chryseobacterium shigense]|uniref:Uncharacterized protein n=1 Tax=Chryseobacterium shigense TaxID=297244 RepID=A0A1N7HWZ6_9FLAO|nr:hypothetical protein [Chryseobacterium shigense]PQA92030.1 hypothetical protein B0A69_16560 [Chryseobacterium shigense]SIS29365.1 hypothetical protein SAMN05421639_101439 [Chryseobacterium shigense]
MTSELKKEIYNKYRSYLAANYNEKYIYRLIIQEGYRQEDVDEVMKDIYADQQKTLKEKNKYRSIISIILYIIGTIVLVAAIGFIIVGLINIAIPLFCLTVIIWIGANR